jgi:hypothetical protein
MFSCLILDIFFHSNNRLSAQKLLKIRKVSNWVVSKLDLELPTKTLKSKDEKTSLDKSTDSLPPPNGTGSDQPRKVAPEKYIDILCNNKVTPHIS